MAQEFIIKSQQIEDKINQLLPSQGGFQAGVDFSASTMVIPIVDLTESAEGSNLRQDLQTSLSLNSCTAHDVQNTTSTLVNTTGYYRVNGVMRLYGAGSGFFAVTDGFTTKTLMSFIGIAGATENKQIDFNVFLEAGDSLTCGTSSTSQRFLGTTRQIADISGNLINP